MGRLPADLSDIDQRALDALMELQSARPFDDISIVELCKSAYISRQTFYRHYKSKEDVYLGHLDQLLGEMFTRELEGAALENIFDSLGRLLERNRPFLSCLFRANLDSRILHRFENLLNSMGVLNGFDSRERNMQAFLAGGIFNTMKRWAKSEASAEAGSYVRDIEEICAPIIRSARTRRELQDRSVMNETGNTKSRHDAIVMVIRVERQGDHDAVREVVRNAFATAEHSDGNEHDLVDALRQSDAYVPELSLVCEVDGEIVGHTMFTELHVGDHVALALAPLSVAPAWQRRGIGTALISEGHRIARDLGYDYSIVLGSDEYYPRVGYVPAETLGILPCFDVPSENFMACRLCEDAPAISGVVRYAEEFGID